MFSWILLRTRFQFSETSEPSRTEDKTVMFLLLLRSLEMSTSENGFRYKLQKRYCWIDLSVADNEGRFLQNLLWSQNRIEEAVTAQPITMQ